MPDWSRSRQAIGGDWLRSVTYSPDVRIISVTDDRMIRTWDVETGSAVRKGHTGHVLFVACSSYGAVHHLQFPRQGGPNLGSRDWFFSR